MTDGWDNDRREPDNDRREPGQDAVHETRAGYRRGARTDNGDGRFPDPLRGDDGPGDVVCVDGEVRVRVGPGAFVYRVRDGAIPAARIRVGDCLVVEPRSPRPGDWVLTLVEGETRLLRVEGDPRRPWLREEDRADGRRFRGGDLVVQGVVAALIRRVSGNDPRETTRPRGQRR